MIAPPFHALKEKGFEIEFVSHARSILVGEFAGALAELEGVLGRLELPITEIIGSGGGETKFTQRLRKALAGMGWAKHNFEISKIVDGVQRESTSHEVDHVRRVSDVGTIACEIEWNNKDPFFDRDLENFKRLHAEGAISVGVLITRGRSLQDSMHENVLLDAGPGEAKQERRYGSHQPPEVLLTTVCRRNRSQHRRDGDIRRLSPQVR